MKKCFFLLFAMFLLSCKNNVKYVLYDNLKNNETIVLQGYLVYRNHEDNFLYYFDIENNHNRKTPFELNYSSNNHYRDFDFFLLNQKRVMTSYDIDDKENVIINIYAFPDFNLLKTINTGFHFDNNQYYKFKYIPETNELYIVNPGSDNIIIELNTNYRRLVSLETKLYYYNNSYIGKYVEPENQQSDIVTYPINSSYPFLSDKDFRFSGTFGKVLYREENGTGACHICIYDLHTKQKMDTGLPADRIPLYAADEYQFSFMGDDLILYGVKSKNVLKKTKYLLIVFLSGGMKNDPPLVYKIYDLKSRQNIGCFKNIDTFDILTYY